MDTQNSLISEKEDLFARMTQMNDYFSSITKSTNSCMIESKIIRLKKMEDELSSLKLKIFKFNASQKDASLKVKFDADTFDDVIDCINGIYLSYKTSSKNVDIPVSSIKGLKIDLKSFDGNIESWINWKALYDSIVHSNSQIPVLQKFHILLSHVENEALALISNLKLSEANYKIAYDILDERFNSKRRLVHHYVNQLLMFKNTDSKTYTQYLTSHVNSIEAIKNLNLNDIGDTILFCLSYSNLNKRDKFEFDNEIDHSVVPTCTDLMEFIKKKAQTFELQADTITLSPKASKKLVQSKSNQGQVSKRISLVTQESKNVKKASFKIKCSVCQGEHRIYTCPEFTNLSIPGRIEFIKKHNRCLCCLGSHETSACESKNKCFNCNSSLHHTLLHTVTSSEPSTVQQCLLSNHATNTVLLSTVELEIKDKFGFFHRCKGIVDNGSQISAITTRLVKRLHLPCTTNHSNLTGFGTSSLTSSKVTNCNVRSPNKWRVKLEFSALVVDSICTDSPNTQLSSSAIDNIKKRFHNLTLADSTFYEPSKIDILLGADLFSQIISKENPVFIPGSPGGLGCIFGYLLTGKTERPILNERSPVSLLVQHCPNLDRDLQAFWEFEEIKGPKPENPDNLLAEKHFLQHVTRTTEGRYQVRLCFKPNSTPLLNNRAVVMKRFFSQEKKLLNKLDVKLVYDKFFEDYATLQHMYPASVQSEYLLPHHAVFKPFSSTTAIRAVFDGSFRDVNGNSLNLNLCTGRKLQLDLPQIIDAFRSHEIVLCCDIEKMYRNILIHPDDRMFQHILWRPQADMPLQEWELATVTYGTSQAPYLAQRCLLQLITDEGAAFKRASYALTHHCYVDDVITGAENLVSAKLLYQELRQLLSKGCFNVKKWVSNSKQLLSSIPTSDIEKTIQFSEFTEGVKILGLIYNPESDMFTYHITPFSGTVTKRNVLSYIFKIFDCNGYLAPVILKAKQFMQNLWCLNLTWDEEIPEPQCSQWIEFSSQLLHLTKVKIYRKINHSNANYRLLCFCDASTTGIGCCVYIHVSNDVDFSKCYLLRAKTKVSPLKPLTIPRAELLAAVQVTKLVSTILCDSFPFKIKESLFFTDSAIVLAWLKTEPYRLTSFVGNRIVQILEITSIDQWFHISGDSNPADICSRGTTPLQLLDSHIYWNGPDFTKSVITHWPLQSSIQVDKLPEIKPKLISLLVKSELNLLIQLMENISSLSKLQRVIAYVRRFIFNCKFKTKRSVGPLSTSELHSALMLCVKVSQAQYFEKELQMVNNNKTIRSPLRKLSPFLESDILYVGGRLDNTNLSLRSKHPILLSAKSRLATLICDHYHALYCHAGITILQPAIQQNWWIVSLRSLLKRRIFNCLRCYRLKAKPVAPLMAALPSSRVQASECFSSTGMDFFGPFDVKESHRKNARTYKAYGCIFVCFTTKAVHIEIVSSLTTEAFLAALSRFLSRRGFVRVLYCDNATNFVGASREIKKVQQWLIQNEGEIFSSLALKQIRFEFNVPTASSMGGLWESAVKCAKTLLHRLVGSLKLTFEEYCTVYSRIEAVLNSRPLVYLSSTPDDGVDYLSPGHFLIGRPLLTLPEEPLEESISLQSRWKRLCQITQSFWVRWSTQYLHTQIQRHKWTSPQPNLREGMVVLISDLRTHPLSWPLGRIEAVLPGKDNVVRVVRVKTRSGIYTRPVNKLVALPMV